MGATRHVVAPEVHRHATPSPTPLPRHFASWRGGRRLGYPTRYCHADFAPIGEGHRVAPQDSYALSKSIGEALMDAAVARRDMIGLSIRSTWVHWEGNIERNLGLVIWGSG